MKSCEPFGLRRQITRGSRGRGLARNRDFSPPSLPAAALEPRWLPSTLGSSAPAVEMLSATTTDSKSVTISYEINQPVSLSTPVDFGIYQSSKTTFDSSAAQVGTFALVPPGSATGQPATLDESGQDATSVGVHTLTIPLPQGLVPYPEKPEVLVVADPDSSTATTDPAQAAAFRTYTIGVVTHGGIQDPSWKNGPPWQLQIARDMKNEGFDAVIPYNWVAESSTPGQAIKQSRNLARDILQVASRFPTGSVVNLDLIGHSEGTVVNTYALVALESEMTPELKSGYIVDTLLDPHAANNDVPGQQVSYAGPLGGLADAIVSHYQSEAKDPPAYIPSIVDEAQVFYEHTAATALGMYNLWGQVPVASDGPTVHYYDLTPMGITHSGDKGVTAWYRDFIVPTLGEQTPLVSELQLDGHIDGAVSQPVSTAPVSRAELAGERRWPEQVVQSAQPVVSGTAAPGSLVRIYLGPANKPQDTKLAGWTYANADGEWSLSPRRSLSDGQYRTVVAAFSRSTHTRPGLTIVPIQPLGRLVVQSSNGSGGNA
jgi:hypothetical protein